MSRHSDRISDILLRFAAPESGDEVLLDDLLTAFGDRVFGAFVLLLALPNCVPLPVGLGWLLGPLMALVGLQLVIGLPRPWLPRRIRAKRFGRIEFARIIERILPVLRWFERLCRPRLEVMHASIPERVTGLLFILWGAAVSLPIPFTNALSAISAVILAIGVIERDGLMILGGWICSGLIALAAHLFGSAALLAMSDLFHRVF